MSARHHVSAYKNPDLPKSSAYLLEPGQPTPGSPSLLRHSIAVKAGTGMLTCFPSTTRFRLPLGADSPCPDYRWTGNLDLSAMATFSPSIVHLLCICHSYPSTMPFTTTSTYDISLL